MKPLITTHCLDTSCGLPASDLLVVLEREQAGRWERLATAQTDASGRVADWKIEDGKPSVYRLRFDTAAYFRARGVSGFFPEVVVTFEIKNTSEHYHVPLLLSPFGYSTYRGS